METEDKIKGRACSIKKIKHETILLDFVRKIVYDIFEWEARVVVKKDCNNNNTAFFLFNFPVYGKWKAEMVWWYSSKTNQPTYR